MTDHKRKLIEVALPLESINRASAREKSIRHGHPSTLHLWWARRPLAAARAVTFAQMVDDPSGYVNALREDPLPCRKAETALAARRKIWDEACALAAKTKQSGIPHVEPGPAPALDDMLAELERQRLFDIIEDLVLWESTGNERVLQAARDEIWESWRRACAENADHPLAKDLFDSSRLPAFHDPFAGGGALPLEAQRLGLESFASDLNPVAVLINKAMIEIPPRFAGKPSVNPESGEHESLVAREWGGAQGLADDVGYYGQWMRNEAEKRVGHLYPQVEITSAIANERPDLKKYAGKKLTVIAWLWARTVKSPNPAFAQVEVPLVSTFMLSGRAGKEAYVEPVLENGGYRFTVKVGKPKDADETKRGTSASKWNAFRCLMSNAPVTYEYIRAEGLAGRLGRRLMAVVAEGDRGRVYLPPTSSAEATSDEARPWWTPDLEINYHPRDIKTQIYGLTTYGDLFTRRQLVALDTFSDLVEEARERIRQDSLTAGFLDDGRSLAHGGSGATAYAEAMSVYLAFAVDKCADYWSAICTWHNSRELIRNTFGRQAIPMTWDYAEVNPFSDSTGNWMAMVDWARKALATVPASVPGYADQADAQSQSVSAGKVVSTDPPYYDNIGYADLSDFFYVWLRRSLQTVFPELFATLAVPKATELVATPYRHGSREKAEAFFLGGMTEAMRRLAEQAHPAFPVTIYYAFKQSESRGADGTASTGWETFLDAVMQAGFAVSGTWPIRTELSNRLIGTGSNALASSIVLVCRKRSPDASATTRREFIAALKAELPAALTQLQRGNIAPVDLAQAAIGPGMAVFSRYSRVIEADGSGMSVRAAMGLINRALDEILAEQEGEFDGDTRWAIAWFEQFGIQTGDFGDADTLSKAKGTSVDGMVQAGVVEAKGGRVRLLRRDEHDEHWDPATDKRLTVWEMTQHLIWRLDEGEAAAAALARQLGSFAEVARDLAYRLYVICERKKWSQEGQAYNGLVVAWPQIQRLAAAGPVAPESPQTRLEMEE